MKRYFLICIVFVYSLVGANGQPLQGQARLDSLLAELPKAKKDTHKVKLLNDISWEYCFIAPDTGVKYGELGLDLATQLEWEKGQAMTLNVIGNNYHAKPDYYKALEYYDAGMKIHEASNNKKEMAGAMGNMAIVYEALGNNAMSLEYALKELNIYEELGNKTQLARSLTNIGGFYISQHQYPKALEYLDKALKMREESGNKKGIAHALNNIGVVYKEQGNYEAASAVYRKALKIYEATDDQHGIMMTTGNMGNVYAMQKRYKEALSCFMKAMNIAEETGDRRSIAIAFASIGELYLEMAKDRSSSDGYGHATNMTPGYLQKAILYLEKGIEMYKFIGAIGSIQDSYDNLSEAYQLSGNYKAAFEAQEQYIVYKDSIFNKESTEKITRLELEGDYQRKQLADSLKNIEVKKLNALKLQKQKTYTYIGAGAVLLLLGFSFFIVKERSKSEKSRTQAEGLLLNILPSEIADELKDRGATTAKHFDEVTVLFTDFVNFTLAGERMGTQKLVEELHTCFKAFDEIIGKHNIEKIKTIGDAYLAVSGLPVPDSRHAENVLNAAIEIRAFMQNRRQQLGDETFEVRIGIHSGPVVAGIVGVKKFAYDIWGDTVNTAARMEQKSEAGKINISQTTYELVRDKFSCTYRGEIEAKNKGMMKMYFVEG